MQVFPSRRKWQPIPVFLPGESHRQRALEGYSPWGLRVRHDWIYLACAGILGLSGLPSGKEFTYNGGDSGDVDLVPGLEDPLENGIATHSSILDWRIPWTEEPNGLQSIGLQRTGYDWSNLACMHAGISYFLSIKVSYKVPCCCF